MPHAAGPCPDALIDLREGCGAGESNAALKSPESISNKVVLQRAAHTGETKRIRHYRELRQQAKTLFNRPGRIYDFAPTPTPCVWSATVWGGGAMALG